MVFHTCSIGLFTLVASFGIDITLPRKRGGWDGQKILDVFWPLWSLVAIYGFSFPLYMMFHLPVQKYIRGYEPVEIATNDGKTRICKDGMQVTFAEFICFNNFDGETIGEAITRSTVVASKRI